MKDLTIKNQIDKRYRAYAVYVIESRGIPNWYDSLTNVQRILIDNCSSTFNKTLSIVGAAISAGYHAGNASLESSINKLARPFNCAESIFIGDGFFGNVVSPNASAARYTSVKINSKFKNIIDKFYHLNIKNEENLYNNFIIDTPIGLCGGIVGIAVGYKSTILPRKIEDINDFINGKIKKIKPYFKNFNGKISKYQSDRSWLIEGVFSINEKDRSINITEIPPLIKYESFLRKINNVLDLKSYTFENNSADTIDLTIKLSRNEDTDTWNEVKSGITKACKLLVTESIVFVKDKSVIEYEALEDYLLDFKDYKEKIYLNHKEWVLNENNKQLEYLEAKKKFLEFMVAKKRKESEINDFFFNFDKWIREKLDLIKLRYLTQEEIQKTIKDILDIKLEIKQNQKDYKEQEKLVKSMNFVLRGRNVKPSTELFDEDDQISDEFEVFKSENEIVNEEEQEVN